MVVIFAFIFALQTLASAPLNNGSCLDSVRAVPQGLFGSDQSSAIVRIDKIQATSSFLEGEMIGYLYTRRDGTTWLGQRRQEFMSAAASRAMNAVFGSTHLPNATITQFPPQRRFGVRTNYTEIFQVNIPQSALDPLHIALVPCVAWPAGKALPDPLP